MEVGELEESVGVVARQLGQGAHLRDGVNRVAHSKVRVGANLSEPGVPRYQLE